MVDAGFNVKKAIINYDPKVDRLMVATNHDSWTRIPVDQLMLAMKEMGSSIDFIRMPPEKELEGFDGSYNNLIEDCHMVQFHPEGMKVIKFDPKESSFALHALIEMGFLSPYPRPPRDEFAGGWDWREFPELERKPDDEPIFTQEELRSLEAAVAADPLSGMIRRPELTEKDVVVNARTPPLSATTLRPK